MSRAAFGDDANKLNSDLDTCCALGCDEEAVIAAGATPMCEAHLIKAYSAIGEYLRSKQGGSVDVDPQFREWLTRWEIVPPMFTCPPCGMRLQRNRETGEVFCMDTKNCWWWNTPEEWDDWSARVIAAHNEIDEVVYYVRFGDRVKIGTTKNLSKRLLDLPHDEVMATEPGGTYVERQRHRQFKHLHAKVGTHREWFQLTPELADHIAAVRARAAA